MGDARRDGPPKKIVPERSNRIPKVVWDSARSLAEKRGRVEVRGRLGVEGRRRAEERLEGEEEDADARGRRPVPMTKKTF